MDMQLPPGVSSIEDIVEISESYEERIELLHQFTVQKVSHALFLIDDAISAWEAAGKKPESLRRRIVVMREFKEAFAGWEKQSITSSKKKAMQKKLLDEFFRLCDDFETRLAAVGG